MRAVRHMLVGTHTGQPAVDLIVVGGMVCLRPRQRRQIGIAFFAPRLAHGARLVQQFLAGGMLLPHFDKAGRQRMPHPLRVAPAVRQFMHRHRFNEHRALGLGHLAAGGTGAQTFTDPLGAGLVQVPAALVVAGAALALYGWVPRLVPLCWALLAWTFVVGMLGGLLDLPGWLVDLSPYAHLPVVPGHAVTPGPLVVLVAVAVLLGVVGVLGLRRRDLAG